MPIPRGVEVERRIVIERTPPTDEFPEGRDEELVIEPNTNEKAVVRILVPTKKVKASELETLEKPSPRRSPEPNATPDRSSTPAEQLKTAEEEEKKGEGEDKEDELVDVEEDQNDMALAVPNRVSVSPAFSVYVIHQYAQRQHRNDFVQQIVRHLWDFFQEQTDDQKKIEDLAQKTAQ